MIRTLLSASLAALLAVAAPASAQESRPDRPTYGPRLERYDYPFPVRTYGFTSQRQPLEMTYMDVAPTGSANGRTAVLLHGKNFCAATWAPTIRVLADAGFRVVAIDQIGFCKASKPDAYQFSLPQLATNTRGLLDSLNIDRAVVIGHSMGGMLASRFAIMHPDAVEHLVLVNPIGLEDWQAEGVPYASLDAAYANERRTNFDSIKAYQQKVYYDGQWRPEYDEPVAMLAGMYTGPGGDAVAWNQAQTSDMIFTQPIAHEFARIAAPTTLIIGGTDRTAPGANRASTEVQARLGQYPALGRRTAEAIPDATLIEFSDLGHAPQTQDPDRFHEALLKALN
ncbi:alpha/beta fold hydrolase [Brevundimonas sp. G8]|uniref:alpha/beta fold hydrolase n=1 Tax=Brevundimonas sp. G8 TaxID=1350776 RepID=UPI0012F10DA9|nr:alpha/beta hydrolase [Brevundimonas sp. G8]VXA90811.1 Alpha/beta hydrolase [Brevundimonas sp. G8]